MTHALNSFEVIKAMAEIGNPNSLSDAGVGAACARAAVIGAFLNVQINASGLKVNNSCQLTSLPIVKDREFAEAKLKSGREIVEKAKKLEEEILNLVQEKISKA